MPWIKDGSPMMAGFNCGLESGIDNGVTAYLVLGKMF